VAFDGAGTVGQGEPGGDRGPVLAESFGESAQLTDRAGLGLGGPGRQVFAVPVAEHLGELSDQGLGGRQFGAACGDLRQFGARSGSVRSPGGVRIHLATFLAAGAGGGAGVVVRRC
jgi:hypothetical protein